MYSHKSHVSGISSNNCEVRKRNTFAYLVYCINRSNGMKGIDDVWNMCIMKCITNELLIGIMLIKGDNCGHNDITYY